MSWRDVPLADVADIERTSVKPEDIVSGTEYLGLEHIESGGEIIGRETVENGDLASSKFSFTAQHVLYGKLRPYLAKIALPEFSGVCSTDIVPIRPGPELDRRYLGYFLRQPSMVDFANSRSTGANLPRLSPKSLAQFPIPIPPLEEQKRIAGILDQADALRRLRTRALDKLNTLGQAIFHEMFGDVRANDKDLPKARVGAHCERVSVGVVVKPASHYVDAGVPAIRGTNIKPHGLDLSDLVYFSPEANIGPLRKSRIACGDVLAVRSGRPGLATVVPEELDGANCIDVLIATPKRKSLLPEYLRDFLNSPDGRALVLSNSRGQVQQHFNVKSLAEAEIPLPPIADQRTYLERVAKIERQRRVLLASNAQIDILVSSLRYRAFLGNL